MISFIHYISALRRKKESDKTVYMMGGRDECDAMILAQNEMIGLEVEYYKEESIRLFVSLIIFCIFLFMFVLYFGE